MFHVSVMATLTIVMRRVESAIAHITPKVGFNDMAVFNSLKENLIGQRSMFGVFHNIHIFDISDW